VLVTVVAMVVALVAVTACSSGDDDDAADGDESSTTEARETTSTTEDVRAQEEAAVREARQAASDAWNESTGPPAADPENPAIAETHVGPMYDQLIATSEAFMLNGWVIRYPEDSQYELVIDSVRFDEDDEGQPVAFLDVCTVDDGERVVVSTGEVLDSGLQTVKAEEAMRKVDGVWKLAERREEPPLEGAQCEDG
jgi:hypothetical protein